MLMRRGILVMTPGERDGLTGKQSIVTPVGCPGENNFGIDG